MGTGCDDRGDLGEVQVHRLGVAGRQDQGRALALLWADGAEDVGRGGPLITRSAGAGATLRPPAGDLVLLADPSLVREPYFYLVDFDRPGIVQKEEGQRQEKPIESERFGSDGDDGEPPSIDPIIAGLLKRLPKSGEVWPVADRKLWLDLLEDSFKLIYKDKPEMQPLDIRN